MNKIPDSINDKILNDINKRLNPDFKYILAKLFLVHILTTIITLAICPQFGFQFIKTSLNLMHYFMIFGQHFCDFACGVFFTSTSCFMALLIIKRDELRAIRHHKFILTSAIILLSIGFFLIMSTNLFFELSFLWILGALAGAMLTIEFGTKTLLTNSIFLDHEFR